MHQIFMLPGHVPGFRHWVYTIQQSSKQASSHGQLALINTRPGQWAAEEANKRIKDIFNVLISALMKVKQKNVT